MLAALVALLISFALLMNSAGSAEPAATAEDPSTHFDSRLDRPPSPLDLDLEEHPLYEMSAPSTGSCDLPDLDTSSADSWEAFSQEIGLCLDEFWQPHLEDLGLRTDTPSFHVTEQNPDTGIQEGVTLAYYEGEKLSITVVLPNVTELAENIPDDRQEGVWSALLGHEYGHHVQQASGILDKAAEMEVDASSELEALEALRRTELQAECLGGMAMQGIGVFDTGELNEINRFLNGGNDLPTHGSARNRQHWFDQGRSQDSLESCNTYGAAPSLVR